MVVSEQNVCVTRIKVGAHQPHNSVALAFDFEPRSPPRILPSTTLWIVEPQPRASSALVLPSPLTLRGTDGLSAQTSIDMDIEFIVIRKRPRTKRTLAHGGGSCHPRRSGPHPGGVVRQWSLSDVAYAIAVIVVHVVNQRPAAASERPPCPGILRW